MAKYLGEVEVDAKDTPYFAHIPQDWALEFISRYSQIDGGHHKAWVLDQVARILLGAPVTIKKATWDDGNFEYRFSVGTSREYESWRGEDYDEGIAP